MDVGKSTFWSEIFVSPSFTNVSPVLRVSFINLPRFIIVDSCRRGNYIPSSVGRALYVSNLRAMVAAVVSGMGYDVPLLSNMS